MTAILRAGDTSDWLDFIESDFPLAIGLSSGGAVIFGSVAEPDASAWFGLANGQLFLQAVDETVSVQFNGKKLDASTWLVAGDTIQLDSAQLTVSIDNGVVVLSPNENTKILMLTPPGMPLEKEQSTQGAGNNITEPLTTKTHFPEESQASNESKVSISSPFEPLPTAKGKSRLRIALLSIFMLLLCGVIYVLVAVPIEITISPSPEIFSISKFPLAVKVGDRYLAFPGSYRVFAEKTGYRDLEETINVELGKDSIFKYELIKSPGFLSVMSAPVKGAEVLIDGIVIGKTPLSLIELEAGHHKLSIDAQRYLPNIQMVEIQGMGIKQSVDITLEPGWGILQINSDPHGADVWLNGEKVGTTPLKTETMEGAYRLELRNNGWIPEADNIEIVAGKTIEMPTYRLQKIKGMLQLTSTPSGAAVMLDGAFRGHTPVSIAIVPDKDHRLSLSKNGFKPGSIDIRVEGGRTKSIDVQLKQEYGIVFITSNPADANLTVDGKEMGAASQRLRLRTVPHLINVSKDGYEPFTVTVTPTAGVSKKINVSLKSYRQAKAAKIPEEIKTSEGQVLRRILLSKPVVFQMGASRREPGRRSNETQYKVELTRTFFVSESEVTNAAFQRFRQAHNPGSYNGFDLNETEQPVSSVNWDEAAAYLNWLSEKDGLPPVYKEKNGKMGAITPISTGYRLPTEAEWAFISRYQGGIGSDEVPLKFPWGKDRFPKKKCGNFADSTAKGTLISTIKGYTDGYSVAAPVCQFERNPVGICDLGGNVSEWCHDYYDIHPAVNNKIMRDPTGPDIGKYHVIRGASWRHGSITELRLSFRDYADKPRNDLGFRIARYAE